MGPYRPPQKTEIPNLFLAGAHTKTDANVWSIGGAIESGRKAAKLIDNSIVVKGQYTPYWPKILKSIDDILFWLKLPSVIDIMLIIVSAILILCILNIALLYLQN